MSANRVLRPRSVQLILPQRVYRFRMLGMGAAALAIALVRQRVGWSPWTLALLVFTAVVWPQLAWLLARRSAQPFTAELRNLIGDSLLAGLWVPLMHFNLLPSVLLVTVATADKINSGVRGLWLRALPAMVLGIVAGGLATGFAVRLAPDTEIVLACLPLMVVHTLAVSVGAYRLITKLQLRNTQLLALSRQDPLTGLANRRYWFEESAQRLRQRSDVREPSTLMMIDMDQLKAINDEHGHAAGDAAIGTLATLIRAHAGPDALCGRLGGDEFIVLLPCASAGATRVADRLRSAFAAARWPEWPELRCTVSIGISAATGVTDALRDVSEAADSALYRAKQAGRNRSVGADSTDGRRIAGGASRAVQGQRTAESAVDVGNAIGAAGGLLKESSGH